MGGVIMIEGDGPIDAAAAWHARLDAPDMDWNGFAAWLAADPLHRTTYDAIAVLDAQIGVDAPAITARIGAAEPVFTSRWRRIGVGGVGALAASIAVLVAIPILREAPARSIATGRGVGPTIALTDGSTMRVDRHSRLRLTGGGSPVVTLLEGTASFSVRHDPSRSFVVRAGGYDIRDIGTRFDVSTIAGHVSVAVAQGRVGVTPHDLSMGEETMVGMGQRLDIDTATQTATRGAIAPQSVAAWIDGRLSYDDAPLALVAADVSRYAGETLVIDPSASSVRFSGVLTIGDGSRLVDQMVAVLPIGARRVSGVRHLYRTGGR